MTPSVRTWSSAFQDIWECVRVGRASVGAMVRFVAFPSSFVSGWIGEKTVSLKVFAKSKIRGHQGCDGSKLDRSFVRCYRRRGVRVWAPLGQRSGW